MPTEAYQHPQRPRIGSEWPRVNSTLEMRTRCVLYDERGARGRWGAAVADEYRKYRKRGGTVRVAFTIGVSEYSSDTTTGTRGTTVYSSYARYTQHSITGHGSLLEL